MGRKEKYKAKLDSDVLKKRYDDTKKLAVNKKAPTIKREVEIEEGVKTIIDGEPAFLQHYYMIFAKEIEKVTGKHTGSTAQLEVCALFWKWCCRGLDSINLNKIATYMSMACNIKLIQNRGGIQNLFAAQVFDDVTTSANSGSVDMENYEKFILYLDIDSTLTPTDIRFIVQFSNDNVNWYDYTNDFFGDLRYEDVATASGLLEAMSGLALGRYARLRIVATGTTAANLFTVSAAIEPYK